MYYETNLRCNIRAATSIQRVLYIHFIDVFNPLVNIYHEYKRSDDLDLSWES